MSNETKNLMGLNLNVDSEMIAEAVRETIIASIASGLDNKENIVNEFVRAILSEKVLVENGEKPRGYSSEKVCSRMEYGVRKAIIEITKEEIANMLEEQKPILRELIRKELMKSKTQSNLVSMFIDSLSMALTSRYNSTVSVDFSKKEEY